MKKEDVLKILGGLSLIAALVWVIVWLTHKD